MNIRLADPWLLLLGLIPLAAWWFGRRRRRGVAYSSLIAFDGVETRTWRTRLRWLPDGLRMLSLAIATTAVARPQILATDPTPPSPGQRIMFVVDVSGSMGARDGESGPTRIDIMKQAIGSLLGRDDLPRSAAVGIVTISEFPKVACPLTSDRRAVLAAVESLQLNHLSDRTNLGDAIGLALNRLGRDGGKNRSVLLYSDGAHNVDESLSVSEAGRIAESMGVAISAVAIGGQRGEEGSDAANLRRLSEMTGGAFLDAEDSSAKLPSLLSTVGAMEAEGSDSSSQSHDLFGPLLACSLGVLFIELTLRRALFAFA